MATPRPRLRQRDPAALRTTATPGPSNSARTPAFTYVTHTPGTSSSASTSIDLPPYEPLAQPLLPQGVQSITDYARGYEQNKLHDQIRVACEGLAEHAGSLNVYLRDREESLSKRKAKRARLQARPADEQGNEGAGGAEVDEQLEKEAEEIRQLTAKVDAMTKRMEEKVMKLIDNEANVDHVKRALKDVHSAAGGDSAASGTQATGATNSQRANTRIASQSGMASTARTSTTLQSGADDDVEQAGDAANHSQAAPKSIVGHFQELVQTSNDDYQARSRHARYAEHHLFVGFKQETHAERYGEGGPPLAPASRWFAESNGGEARPGATAAGVEDDEDFSISHENISINCPLTMLPFKTPVTCKKCHHSYEKSAIEEMLATQRPPTAGAGKLPQGWVRSMQCPVAGCSQTLEKKDLDFNQTLARKIKRLQNAKERASRRREEEAEDDDDDDTQRGATNDRAEEIESDSTDDLDAPGKLTQIKKEMRKRKQREDIEDD